MDKKQSREMRVQIRRVLMETWDPIGIGSIPEAEADYDSYLGEVYALLLRNASIDEIADYLRWVETSRMELHLPEQRRNAAAVALKEITPPQT